MYIKGAPDPQEWLVSREVEIECRYKDMKERDIDEMVGHLLYWSTLYGIKTHKMQEEGFSKWLEYISRGPFYTLLELPNCLYTSITSGNILFIRALSGLNIHKTIGAI